MLPTTRECLSILSLALYRGNVKMLSYRHEQDTYNHSIRGAGQGSHCRDLGGNGTRMGYVRADAPTGTAVNKILDVLAAGPITINGPASGSLFALGVWRKS